MHRGEFFSASRKFVYDLHNLTIKRGYTRRQLRRVDDGGLMSVVYCARVIKWERGLMLR